MTKAEIMKEFRRKQKAIAAMVKMDEYIFELTKQLVIDTGLKLKELKENENS